MITTCGACGGTRLAPARSGTERGTCHCPRKGQIIAHVMDGGSYWYEVYFEGSLWQTEPPTLAKSYALLEDLRVKQLLAGGDDEPDGPAYLR